MVKLLISSSNGSLIKEITLNDENLINQRFKRKKSILDLLIENGINIHFGCMGGSCSACVVELISGEENIDREGCGNQIYRGIAINQMLTCIAAIKQGLDENSKVELKLVF